MKTYTKIEILGKISYIDNLTNKKIGKFEAIKNERDWVIAHNADLYDRCHAAKEQVVRTENGWKVFVKIDSHKRDSKGILRPTVVYCWIKADDKIAARILAEYGLDIDDFDAHMHMLSENGWTL